MTVSVMLFPDEKSVRETVALRYHWKATTSSAPTLLTMIAPWGRRIPNTMASGTTSIGKMSHCNCNHCDNTRCFLISYGISLARHAPVSFLEAAGAWYHIVLDSQ